MSDTRLKLEVLNKKMSKAPLLLKKTAKNLVFGHGSPQAKIFFIGEAPGKQEDLQGLPFVGSAGKVLDKLLALIDLKREDIYITSILKYRPPNNRNPSLAEICNHTPYLIEQIKIIKPTVIVTLGNFSTRFVLNECKTEKMEEIPGISQLHGKIKRIELDHGSFSVLPLYHPAAALYAFSLYETLKKDFKVIKKLIL